MTRVAPFVARLDAALRAAVTDIAVYYRSPCPHGVALGLRHREARAGRSLLPPGAG